VTRQFNRQVLVYVRDADNHLVEGSTIKWKENGQDRGSIDPSDGHGTLTPVHQKSIVEVTVEYDGLQPETRTLAADQNNCTIVFPSLHLHPTTWTQIMEKHFPAFAGIFFILIAIILAFVFSNPNPLQIHIILALFSLGGGAFGSEIPGLLNVNLTITSKFVIAATGAAAIFVILYFAVPAGAK